jgi:hypothetical protein
VVVHVYTDGLQVGGLVNQRPPGLADRTLDGRAMHAADPGAALGSLMGSVQIGRTFDHGVIMVLVLVQLFWLAALAYLAWFML